VRVDEPKSVVEPATWPADFVSTAADRRAVLVLASLRGITPRKLIEVAAERGSASATLAWIREGRAGSENDVAFANDVDPEEVEAAVAACGARIVPWASRDYPGQLTTIPDPPAVLFLIGRPAPDPTRAVAVVGARSCSPLGREIARDIGRSLALAGAVVVSGAARGIDFAAHEGALAAGGGTLAVMGSGIGCVYPASSRRLVERIAAAGTVVSEYPPGTPPTQWSFPARNRIVAGMARATVVVEGAKGSGSMISAEHAMEFGRDVYAVPGAVTNALAETPLQLIRDGATMIRGAEDLLHDLGLELVADEVADRVELSDAERDILGRLTAPALPDRLASAVGASVPEVVGILMRLELRGFVRSVGGRYEMTLSGAATSR
jgi:DNA processing protein